MPKTLDFYKTRPMEFKSTNRREVLLEQMKDNDLKGINCSSCTGKCCTFVANSMQITELEGLEILDFLNKKNQEYTSDFWSQRFQKVIDDFRLNQVTHLQGGKKLRKTYTCPFFNVDQMHPGCYLSMEIKPYGCLGFNPHQGAVKDGENCGQDRELLERRESKWSNIENSLIEKQLTYPKEALPIVLRDLLPLASK